MFNDYVYVGRRDQLRKEVGNGIILLLGNDESPMNYADNIYHFRQDSSFLYFLGINRPGLFAILDTEKGTDVVYGEDFTVEDFVWRGKQPTIAEAASLAGIKETGNLNTFHQEIDKAIRSKREIHFLPPYRPENVIKLHNLLGIDLNSISRSASTSLIKAVVAQRNIKSDEEIVEIEKAVNTSVEMHVTAMKMVREGMLESQVAAEMSRIALAEGGSLAFPVIATKNGATLHNHYHGNRVKNGDLFLLDCGAETAMGYAGDLSSTFPVGSTFSTRQKEIYEIVLEAHIAAVNTLRPGFRFVDTHLTACRSIVDGLKKIGLMKGDTEEAVQAGAHALFFPCGTGHMMGLDVHDMEDLGEVFVGYDGKPKSTLFGLKSLRLARELQPGFVLTIEPGVYFIPELIDKWNQEGKFREFLNYPMIETFKGFSGIRNEEDFLITPDGKRLLGKQKPMSITEVEQMRKS
jgi:Xaa-Pro aminopeptidase